MSKIIIERDKYFGKPELALKREGDKYPFIFGVYKAKMLLQALHEQPDLLERFVGEIRKKAECNKKSGALQT